MTIAYIDQPGDSRLVSRTTYARMRGVSYAAVREAILTGRIRLVDGKMIDPEAADREWEASTDPTKGGRDSGRRPGPPRGQASGRGDEGPTGGTTLYSVKTQHEQMRLELARVMLEERRGALIDAAATARAWAAEGRRTQAAVMGVAQQLGAALAACGDPQECTRMMAAALREALGKLAGR